MNLDKILRTRASIQNYSDKKIKENQIIEIIEAATLAPSPGNLSILKFIIIEDEETIQKITQACQQQFIAKAPVLIVVCSNSKKVDIMYDKRADKYIKHHVGAAVENLLLKITELGLASCWTGAFSESSIKSILKIPDETEVEVVLPIAYPHKINKTKQKLKTDLGNVIYFETWNNKYKRPIEKIKRH